MNRVLDRIDAGAAGMTIPSGVDFAAYYSSAGHETTVLPAQAFMSEVIDDLDPQAETGVCRMPWQKTHAKIGLRRGEVSLHGGINGHGKSLATGQMAVSLIAQGEKVLICSFEMKPRRTLGRMLIQASHTTRPELDFAKRFIGWLGSRMWFWDQQGTVKPKEVLGVIRYAAERLGVGHVVVDSLMKCVKGEEDYDGQKDFVDELTVLARDLDVHIHLVHHIRKQQDESKVPGKMDFRGAGAITDLVDNVFVWWRNKSKERSEQDGSGGLDILAEPDALLVCEKQRNGTGEEGMFKLWMHAESHQLVGTEDRRPFDLMAGRD